MNGQGKAVKGQGKAVKGSERSRKDRQPDPDPTSPHADMMLWHMIGGQPMEMYMSAFGTHRAIGSPSRSSAWPAEDRAFSQRSNTTHPAAQTHLADSGKAASDDGPTTSSKCTLCLSGPPGGFGPQQSRSRVGVPGLRGKAACGAASQSAASLTAASMPDANPSSSAR